MNMPVLPMPNAIAATPEDDASMYVELTGAWNFKFYPLKIQGMF
jgi:hypothetical protein